MIIAINGQLVNTKNIYSISEIKFHYEFGEYSFNIKFFDEKKLTVSKNVVDLGKSSIIINEETIYYHSTRYSRGAQNWVDTHAPELLEMVTEFRNEIVKVWSENQSEIPQFNL